mmetsp:Transcript_3534/g.9745  ORF Transcript_3534/g.9745 Transcript_3534/m.9745 type:complete len:269 (-) Transcript_3534:540-1346(-)
MLGFWTPRIRHEPAYAVRSASSHEARLRFFSKRWSVVRCACCRSSSSTSSGVRERIHPIGLSLLLLQPALCVALGAAAAPCAPSLFANCDSDSARCSGAPTEGSGAAVKAVPDWPVAGCSADAGSHRFCSSTRMHAQRRQPMAWFKARARTDSGIRRLVYASFRRRSTVSQRPSCAPLTSSSPSCVEVKRVPLCTSNGTMSNTACANSLFRRSRSCAPWCSSSLTISTLRSAIATCIAAKPQPSSWSAAAPRRKSSRTIVVCPRSAAM